MGFHPELGHNAGFIAQDVAPAIELNDPSANNTLTEIFVGRADDNLTHTLIVSRFARSGSECVISLKVDHWPNHNTHCFQRFLENGKL